MNHFVPIVAVFFSLYILSTFIFGTGLLSQRTLISEQNTEQCFPEETPLVDQVVVLFIDALRNDFAIPSLAAKSSTSASSYESLTYIEDVLMADPEGSYASQHGIGFTLVADAPTTTAQRAKALTTGSLPAFVEAGKNFNSDMVEEDNLIWQLRRKAVVLGDDTWLNLYPSDFWQEHHCFPSFDVRDLHSNDNGVLAHLNKVLLHNTSLPVGKEGQQAPKLVWAHFLGVDHAGHRYNSRDAHLQAKIAQMNTVLRNVSQLLRSRERTRTMLIVLGDHGMTPSGDHGGDSHGETDTFLFAEFFSGRSNTLHRETAAANVIANLTRHLRQKNCHALCRLNSPTEAVHVPFRSKIQGSDVIPGIYQVDVVATISTLLNLPIPYSNLGTVVPEVAALAMMQSDGKERDEQQQEEGIFNDLLQLYRCNFMQVERYVKKAGHTEALEEEDHNLLFNDEKGSTMKRVERMNQFHSKLIHIASNARQQWTAFNELHLGIGVVLLVFFLLFFIPFLFFPSIETGMSISKLLTQSQACLFSGGEEPSRSCTLTSSFFWPSDFLDFLLLLHALETSEPFLAFPFFFFALSSEELSDREMSDRLDEVEDELVSLESRLSEKAKRMLASSPALTTSCASSLEASVLLRFVASAPCGGSKAAGS